MSFAVGFVLAMVALIGGTVAAGYAGHALFSWAGAASFSIIFAIRFICWYPMIRELYT